MWKVIHNDVMAWAKSYDGPKFHALLCDPPYHLTSITKRFGGQDSKLAQYGSDGAFQRASRGFMGQKWDGGDVAFQPETWAALGEHLYPGAFCFAFASSRGWHRMAVAIEDAGFILHPSLWVYYAFGSGFPKATQIKDYGDFEGYRYGLQAIKPSVEPVICFQKPYENRPVDCITETGAGALNIDAGRIGDEELLNQAGQLDSNGIYSKMDRNNSYTKAKGRWPANLLLSHTPDCEHTDGEWVCIEDCAVRRLGEMSGKLSAGGSTKQSNIAITKNVYGKKYTVDFESFNDSGTAARYFHQSHYIYEKIEQAERIFYTTKPGNKERNAGLDNLPNKTRNRVNSGGLENEDRWQPTKAKNIHPTLKPISLTKYLAGLLLPPDSYAPRRILNPFAGSGSEMIGAILAGWDEVVGIEMTADYIPIAEARLTWWSKWLEWGQDDIDKILASVQSNDNDGQQMEMF